MRITRTDQIAGLPALDVRDALQHCRSDDGFEVDGLAYRLALSTDDAQEVLSQLVADGYVEPYKGRWRTTIAGNALCLAKASKPVTRATAQRQLDAFLERVAEVNASPAYLYKVDRVILFGSFLDPDRDPVGDVDLAVEVTWKEPNVSLRISQGQEHTRKAMREGKSLPTFAQQLMWPYNEVIGYIKGGSRVLSLTGTDDDILKVSAHKTIYERDGS